MSNQRLITFVQASIGGFIAGLSLSQGISLMMPFAVALLWASIIRPFSGFLWGFIAVLVSHRWLLDLHPIDWLGIPYLLSLPISISIWLFCGLIAGLLVWIWSYLANTYRRTFLKGEFLLREVFYVLIFSTLWGLGEVLLSQSPLFWIGIGTSLLPGDRFLAGFSRWIGSGGLACIQFFWGWWLFKIVINFRRQMKWKKIFLFGLSVLFFAHIVGWKLLSKDISYKSIPIAMWQTNIPIREKFSRDNLNRIPEQVNRSLNKANELGASILVAPEGTLQANQSLSYPAPISFLVGGFRWVNNHQRSSLLVFESGETKFSQALDKYRLVPLGEWTPSWKGFSFAGLSAVGGVHPGEPSRKLEWEGPSLAVAICYEISDGLSISNAVRGGAEWILAIANLDPYPISLQREFLSLAQLRSIESGRDLISSANTGPTSLINSSGQINFLADPFQEEFDLVKLHLRKGKTGYLIVGESPLIALLIICLLGEYFTRRN